jgi:phospholipid/cholesterol/gamma-HCH transport system substrate-binding protein
MSLATARRLRNVAVLTIVAVVAVWVWRDHRPPPRNHYTAMFADASEVVARNDVRLNDVIVGKVTSVTLDGLRAKVAFSVDRDVHLPAGTRAELRQVSLLGEQYVALVPSGTGELADGATIPLSRTRRATDFEQLVGAGGELAANIAVSQVNQLTRGFANAFGDDPSKLGRLLDASAATAKAFNDHTPDLLATIDRVEQLSAALAPHSHALAKSIDDLAAGVKALDANRTDLAAFTTGLAAFSDRMAELLTKNETRFTNGIPQMKQVFGELVDSTADIDTWLENFYGLNAAWSCIGDGNFLNETFFLMPALANIDYGPGHCDPEKGNRSRTMQHQLVVPTDGSSGSAR